METGSIWTASATTHSRANRDFPSPFKKAFQWECPFEGEESMATWKRLTRDAPEGPIDVNMEKVALIEREKNRSYTLLIFNFAREDSLSTQ